MSVCKEAMGEGTENGRASRHCSNGLGAISTVVCPEWEGEEIHSTNVQDSDYRRHIWLMDREEQ